MYGHLHSAASSPTLRPARDPVYPRKERAIILVVFHPASRDFFLKPCLGYDQNPRLMVIDTVCKVWPPRKLGDVGRFGPLR